jgi:hypothetical protein
VTLGSGRSRVDQADEPAAALLAPDEPLVDDPDVPAAAAFVDDPEPPLLDELDLSAVPDDVVASDVDELSLVEDSFADEAPTPDLSARESVR